MKAGQVVIKLGAYKKGIFICKTETSKLKLTSTTISVVEFGFTGLFYILNSTPYISLFFLIFMVPTYETFYFI